MFATTNSASVNICVQDYFAGVGNFQLSCIPRSGVARSYGNPICHFGKKLLKTSTIYVNKTIKFCRRKGLESFKTHDHILRYKNTTL